MTTDTDSRRQQAAQHTAALDNNRNGRLRTKKGYCFGGGLCDYASQQSDYLGGWKRDHSGRWTFVDQRGNAHDHHIPVDVRQYLDIDDLEATAIVIGNDILKMTPNEMARLFQERSLSQEVK